MAHYRALVNEKASNQRIILDQGNHPEITWTDLPYIVEKALAELGHHEYKKKQKDVGKVRLWFKGLFSKKMKHIKKEVNHTISFDNSLARVYLGLHFKRSMEEVCKENIECLMKIGSLDEIINK